MNCICCNTPLTNDLDTFGKVGLEMCWECWSSLEFDVWTFEATMQKWEREQAEALESEAT